MASRLAEVEARISHRDGQGQGTSDLDEPKRPSQTHRAVVGVMLVAALVISIGALALWRSFQPSEPPWHHRG